MNRGDTFTIYMDGVAMTVCVLGFYSEEYTGEEMVILALVSQENLVHVPLEDLQTLFPQRKFVN